MRNEGRLTFLRLEERRVVARWARSGKVRTLNWGLAGALVGVPGLRDASWRREVRGVAAGVSVSGEVAAEATPLQRKSMGRAEPWEQRRTEYLRAVGRG